MWNVKKDQSTNDYGGSSLTTRVSLTVGTNGIPRAQDFYIGHGFPSIAFKGHETCRIAIAVPTDQSVPIIVSAGKVSTKGSLLDSVC